MSAAARGALVLAFVSGVFYGFKPSFARDIFLSEKGIMQFLDVVKISNMPDEIEIAVAYGSFYRTSCRRSGSNFMIVWRCVDWVACLPLIETFPHLVGRVSARSWVDHWEGAGRPISEAVTSNVCSSVSVICRYDRSLDFHSLFPSRWGVIGVEKASFSFIPDMKITYKKMGAFDAGGCFFDIIKLGFHDVQLALHNRRLSCGGLCLIFGGFGELVGGLGQNVSIYTTSFDFHPLESRNNNKKEGEYGEIRSEPRDWVCLSKPPYWLLAGFIQLASALGLLGFILLFGPSEHGNSLKRQDAGALAVVAAVLILMGVPITVELVGWLCH